MASSSENTTFHLPKRPRYQKWKLKNKPAAARSSVTMSLSFVLCGIFLLLLWKKFRRFLVGVSCNEKVALDKLCFFLFPWNGFFSKSHHFWYFFIRHHFNLSARKCSLCQTLACTDRRSHKQRLLLPWDNRLLKKERDACRRFCFSNPRIFGNVKRASSVNLCWWQRFPTTPGDASHLLCSTKFLLNGEKKLKILQNFRQQFPQIVLVDT